MTVLADMSTAPTAGESRIGRGGATPGSAARGGSGSGKSRMLANIERMGKSGEH